MFALAEQQELVGPHPHDFVGCGETAGRNVSADAFRGAGAVIAPASAARRTDGVVFDRGVADRAREHVGGRMVVHPERLDHARIGHERAGAFPIGGFELVHVLEDRPELEVIACHQPHRALDRLQSAERGGLPVLAHQEQTLAKAGDALDQVRPHGARDLASAIERDPRLARDAAEGNTGGAAKAMETERQVRTDPEKRAGRFVEQWQGMKEARASMERAGDRAGAERLGKRMESIAGGLQRDSQLESALHRRAPELELKMERGRSIANELAQSVTIGRDRDHGMSR